MGPIWPRMGPTWTHMGPYWDPYGTQCARGRGLDRLLVALQSTLHLLLDARSNVIKITPAWDPKRLIFRITQGPVPVRARPHGSPLKI